MSIWKHVNKPKIDLFSLADTSEKVKKIKNRDFFILLNVSFFIFENIQVLDGHRVFSHFLDSRVIFLGFFFWFLKIRQSCVSYFSHFLNIGFFFWNAIDPLFCFVSKNFFHNFLCQKVFYFLPLHLSFF